MYLPIRTPCTRSFSAYLCKGGHKCSSCKELEHAGNYYNNPSWRECVDCMKCIDCTLNIHKHSLLQPTNTLPTNPPPHPTRGKITQYCTCRLINLDDGTTAWVVYMKLNSYTGKTNYSTADDLTKAVICDHLDRFGLLKKSNVLPPPNYSRRMKYVRRDAPPVPRTSKRPAGHKQEYITCPIKMCDDRTGRCRCLCHICHGYSKECKCCKVCCNKEDECMCCKECGNKEDECTCTVLKFLSLWSL
jgi:hypothetical protein